MEIVFSRVARYLYDVYLESKDLNDEHDCNIASVNSLNIFDASNMPSHKLGDAMFDEYGIFSPPSLWLGISLASWIFKEFMLIILP